jgi:nucleoid-associated protein YgaU
MAEVTPPKEAPIASEPPIAAEPKVTLEAPVTTEPPVKTAPPAATEAPATAEAEPPAPPPAPPAPPQPNVVVAAVEADTAGNVYIAGTATTPETVRVYLDDQPLGEARPSPSGTWLIETKKDMPAGNYNVRADQVGSDGTVIARAEVPFQREVDVAVLTPSGSAGGAAGGGATVSGAMPPMETVIIKRGDNLWRIARSTWGKGIRWSTIYQANTDQIRNPHWIYPGQVFIMPKGNVTWTD